MIKLHLKRTIFFGILGLIAAMVIAFFSPKIYRGTTALLVGEQQNAQPGIETFTRDIQQILQRGGSGNPETEMGVLKTRGVFYRALQAVYDRDRARQRDLLAEPEKYYLMYDVIGEKDSSVAQVEVQAYDPATAADLANEVAIQYNNTRRESSRNSVTDAVAYLTAQMAQSKQDLEKADKQYQNYKSANSLADPTQEYTSKSQYLNTLDQQIDNAKSKIAELDSQISVQKGYVGRLDKTEIQNQSITKSPIVSSIEASITELQRQRNLALAQYYPDSIQVRQVEEAIKLEQEKLNAAKKSGVYEKNGENIQPNNLREMNRSDLARTETAREGLQASLRELEKTRAEVDAKVKKLPAMEVTLVQLQRQRSVLENKYNNLLTQIEQLKNRSETGPRAAVQLFIAQPDDKPVAPDLIKLGIAGTLAGLCLGLLFSFGYESLRLRVRSSSQLAELTGLPVAASVQALPTGRLGRLMTRLAKGEGHPAESFRYMAFTFTASETNEPKVVLFTATGGLGGRAFSAQNFAVAAARASVKTLLVDMDLRRAALTGMYGADGKSGISDVLHNRMLPNEQELSIDTPDQTMKFLPAGTDRDAGLADVPTPQLQAIIEGFREKADLVVIDTPPCDAFSDASRLAKYVDEVCLVVSAKSTNFRNIPLAYEILTRSGAKSVSLILLDASVEDEPFSDRSRTLVRA